MSLQNEVALLFQLDVINAFLHGDLEDDIYMLPLPVTRKIWKISQIIRITWIHLSKSKIWELLIMCWVWRFFTLRKLLSCVNASSLMFFRQFMQDPRLSHWNAALHKLSYVKGTLCQGLFFNNNPSFDL